MHSVSTNLFSTFHRSGTHVYLGYGCRCAPCVQLAAAFRWNSSSFWRLALVYLVFFRLPGCFCGHEVLGRDRTVAWRRPEGGRFLDRGQLPCDLWDGEKSAKGRFNHDNSNQLTSTHLEKYIVVTTNVPTGDKPLPCPAGCGPPAAGRHSSCTPPSAPSSSWPPQNLPCPWHIAFPRRTGPNALPPETITARKKSVGLMVSCSCNSDCLYGKQFENTAI